MRTLERMRERTRRLAHDLKTTRTYDTEDLDDALRDALLDLVDQLLGDSTGLWALYRVTAGSVPADTGAVALPEDCLRLLRVEALESDGTTWRRLPLVQSRSLAAGDDPLVWTATAAGIGLAARLGVAGGAGSVASGFRVLEDGSGIALVPQGVAAPTLRLGYLGEVDFPAAKTAAVALPAGADELLELLAADKLTADEPRDEKRMVMYQSRFAARYRRWTEGRARGAVPRGQLVAGEEEEG